MAALTAMRQPARKGPHQAWGRREDRHANPAALRGLHLKGLAIMSGSRERVPVSRWVGNPHGHRPYHLPAGGDATVSLRLPSHSCSAKT